MATSIEREELAAWLRLLFTPGIGPQTARRLLAAFGPPQHVFAQPTAALGHLLTAEQAQALREPPDEVDQAVQTTWAWIANAEPGTRRHVATLGDPLYPEALLTIEDPPLLLFMLGQLDGLAEGTRRGFALVGSRNPTPQGASDARQFARALASTGLCIVSGLALGVDAAAHEGALEGGDALPVATIAVVGTGLDRVYPARHRDLAHRIARRGVIVSEFPLGTPPLQQNFPRRNRIIAGLSQGTLVVEAALQSGSLITARMAAEQGKDVFAIPGSIHSPQSRGCHALIRQGAKLVESAQDVLEDLRLPVAAPAASAPSPLQEAGPASREDALLGTMGYDPVSLDALVARTGEDTATLQARLLELELDGRVGRLPGGLFQRIAAG